MSSQESKETVEGKEGLSVAELKKGGVFRGRRVEAQYGFRYGEFEMILVHDPIELDWYLKITNPGPRNRNNAITIVETSCHYGGVREWFVCPRCERRCGNLYKDEDDFACRRCMDFGYASQRVNYRSFEPTIVRMKKYEKEIEKKPIYQSYKGKPTKRALRYDKLLERLGSWSEAFNQREAEEL
ncbi:MAG TPA: hypothetical protein VMA75_01365 [Candidatus Paceibacterota bacterium]|nr:hypothetical protein [Candidatus Paceibacterota bacterium]